MSTKVAIESHTQEPQVDAQKSLKQLFPVFQRHHVCPCRCVGGCFKSEQQTLAESANDV